MFNTLYNIAKNTFRESVREPIFLLLTTAALIMIGGYPICTLFVFNGQEKLVIDSAMATTMVFGWIIAVLIASHTISREIANGTALLMLSKPVQRPVFVVAKILGILAALTVFTFLCSAATMISLRMATRQHEADFKLMAIYYLALVFAFALGGAYNYITRQSFSGGAIAALVIVMPIVAVIGHFMRFDGFHVGLTFRVLPALLLIMFSVWSMGTMATALSTRLHLVSNMLLCGVIFSLGLMSDYFIGRNTKEIWQSLPMNGSEPLWVCSYEFNPKEITDIERWENPMRIDQLADFIVYTSNRNANINLGDMGSTPELYWQDSDDWKFNLKDLPGKPAIMGLYDTTKRTWKFVDFDINKKIRENMSKPIGERENLTAYIFRRSYNPPRPPKGGSYVNPLPFAGHRTATIFYAAVPNWQLFWMADALSSRGTTQRVSLQKNTVPSVYIAYATAYTLALISMMALVAVVLFSNREVGKQMIA